MIFGECKETIRLTRSQADLDVVHNVSERNLDKKFDDLNRKLRKSMAIAIYDDNMCYPKLLSISLEEIGYTRIFCSQDPLEYSQYCHSLNGDLIAMIVDLNSKKINSIDLINRFKNKCKIIAMSPANEKCLFDDVPANAVLRKMDDVDEVVRKINLIIKEKF